MDSLNYNIHDILSLSIQADPRLRFSKNWILMDYFSSGKSAERTISATLAPFTPNTKGCHGIDHVWKIRENYAFADFGLYRFEVQNYLEPHTQVRFWSSRLHSLSHLGFYPGELFFKSILRELLFLKLFHGGYTLVHGTAFTYEGKTSAFAGSGGVGKTALWLDMVRRGGSIFGDDLLLLKNDGTLWPFPLYIRTLNYRLKCNNGKDNFSLADKLRWYHFQKNFKNNEVPIAAPAKCDALYIAYRSGAESQGQVVEMNKPMVGRRLYANLTAEMNLNSIHSLIRMVQYVCPHSPLKDFDERYEKMLEKVLGKKFMRVIRTEKLKARNLLKEAQRKPELI